MKKVLVMVVVLTIGLTVLAGYLFRALLAPLLALLFDWGILLAGVAGLIGIGYLIHMNLSKLARREKGAFFSVVVIIAFVFTLVSGLVMTPQSPFFRDLILNVQIPVEASLLGILAVTLVYTSLRLVRSRGWTPMSIAFLASAILSLILNLVFINIPTDTPLSYLMMFIRRLPLIGVRGILLGMALGGLVVGLRVLLMIDRPYGE